MTMKRMERQIMVPKTGLLATHDKGHPEHGLRPVALTAPRQQEAETHFTGGDNPLGSEPL